MIANQFIFILFSYKLLLTFNMRITYTYDIREFWKTPSTENHFSPENHPTTEEYTPDEIRDYFNRLIVENVFDLEYFNYVFDKILAFCHRFGCTHINFTNDFVQKNWRFVDCVKYYQNKILIDQSRETKVVMISNFNKFYIEILDTVMGG